MQSLSHFPVGTQLACQFASLQAAAQGPFAAEGRTEKKKVSGISADCLYSVPSSAQPPTVGLAGVGG